MPPKPKLITSDHTNMTVAGTNMITGTTSQPMQPSLIDSEPSETSAASAIAALSQALDLYEQYLKAQKEEPTLRHRRGKVTYPDYPASAKMSQKDLLADLTSTGFNDVASRLNWNKQFARDTKGGQNKLTPIGKRKVALTILALDHRKDLPWSILHTMYDPEDEKWDEMVKKIGTTKYRTLPQALPQTPVPVEPPLTESPDHSAPIHQQDHLDTL